MTNNQIRFLEHRETVRSDLAREAENTRSNVAREVEQHRTNVVNEGITLKDVLEKTRHNKVAERQARRDLRERTKHNTKTRKETKRHNKVSEKQGLRNLDIQSRNADTLQSQALAAHRQAGAAERNAATNALNAYTNARNAATNERNANTNRYNAKTQRKNVLYVNEHNIRADAISSALKDISKNRLDFDERKAAADLEKWFKDHDLEVAKLNADYSAKLMDIRAKWGANAAKSFESLFKALTSGKNVIKGGNSNVKPKSKRK